MTAMMAVMIDGDDDEDSVPWGVDGNQAGDGRWAVLGGDVWALLSTGSIDDCSLWAANTQQGLCMSSGLNPRLKPANNKYS